MPFKITMFHLKFTESLHNEQPLIYDDIINLEQKLLMVHPKFN